MFNVKILFLCEHFLFHQGDTGPVGPTGPQGVKGEQGGTGEKVNDGETLRLYFVICDIKKIIKTYYKSVKSF